MLPAQDLASVRASASSVVSALQAIHASHSTISTHFLGEQPEALFQSLADAPQDHLPLLSASVFSTAATRAVLWLSRVPMPMSDPALEVAKAMSAPDVSLPQPPSPRRPWLELSVSCPAERAALVDALTTIVHESVLLAGYLGACEPRKLAVSLPLHVSPRAELEVRAEQLAALPADQRAQLAQDHVRCLVAASVLELLGWEGAAPSVALAWVLPLLGDAELVRKIASATAADPAVQPVTIARILARMAEWPMNEAVHTWFTVFFRQLKLLHRFDALTRTCCQAVLPLTRQVVANASPPAELRDAGLPPAFFERMTRRRQRALALIQTVLLGYSDPSAFHQTLSLWMALFMSLDDPAFAASAAQLMQVLTFRVYPGYPDLYAPLLEQIKHHTPLQPKEVDALLRAHHWVLPTQDALSWVEGHWTSAPIDMTQRSPEDELPPTLGNMSLRVESAFAGARLRKHSCASDAVLDGVINMENDEPGWRFTGMYREPDSPVPSMVKLRYDARAQSAFGYRVAASTVDKQELVAVQAEDGVEVQLDSPQRFGELAPVYLVPADLPEDHAPLPGLEPLFSGWWQLLKASREPPARSASSVAYTTAGLLVFGGVLATRRFDNQLWKYPSEPGRIWKQVLAHRSSITPEPRSYAAAAGAGDSMYIFGGALAGGAVTSEMWCFNWATKMWTQLDGDEYRGPWPHARTQHQLCVPKGQEAVYLFGGQYGDRHFDDMWRFDLNTRVWTRLRPIGRSSPPPRSGHSLSDDGEGHLWLFGGQSVIGRLLNDLWCYDLKTGVWHEIHGSAGDYPYVRPPPTQLHAAAACSGQLFMHGGRFDRHGILRVSNDLWRFDIRSRRWHLVLHSSGAPPPRAAHSMVLVPSAKTPGAVDIFIVGGFNHREESCAELYSFQFNLREHIERTHPGDWVYATHFDGHAGYIDCGSADSLSFPGRHPMAVEAWVHPLRTGEYQSALSKIHKHTSGEWSIDVNEDLLADLHREADPYHLKCPATPGRFNHFAQTYDRHTFAIYRDGDVVKRTYFGDQRADAIHSVKIGACLRSGRVDWFYTGTILEARVWSDVRSDSQIHVWHNHHLRGTEEHLAAYWPLWGYDYPALAGRNMAHNGRGDHGIISQFGVVSYRVPVDLLPLKGRAAMPKTFEHCSLHGAATLMSKHVAMNSKKPHTLADCGGAVWFKRRMQVRRGFELRAELDSLDVGEWGGFGFVIRTESTLQQMPVGVNRHELGPGTDGFRNALSLTFRWSRAKSYKGELEAVIVYHDDTATSHMVSSISVPSTRHMTIALSYANGHFMPEFNGQSLPHAQLDLGQHLGMTDRMAYVGFTVFQEPKLNLHKLTFAGIEGSSHALATELARPLEQVQQVLADMSEDVNAARAYLLEHPEDIPVRVPEPPQVDNTLGLTSRQAAAFPLLHGHWETSTLGALRVRGPEDVVPVRGYVVQGTTFGGSGRIRGFLFRAVGDARRADDDVVDVSNLPGTAAQGWTLVGMQRRRNELAWRPCVLKFNDTFTAYSGVMTNSLGHLLPTAGVRPTSGPYRSILHDPSFPHGASARKGLQNLGNTCYMNTFLQSLYLTRQLRDAIFSTQLDNSLKLQGEAPSALIAGSRGDPPNTLLQLQRLFLAMRLSERPTLSAADFQRCLPSPWKDPHQQDSSEFGSFLLDRIAQAFPDGSEQREHFERLFQGRLVNAIQCTECTKLSLTEDMFSTLSLTFPAEYSPITDLAVVIGEDIPPAGFHKIFVDLNPSEEARRRAEAKKASEAQALAKQQAAEDKPPEPPAPEPAGAGAGSGAGSAGAGAGAGAGSAGSGSADAGSAGAGAASPSADTKESGAAKPSEQHPDAALLEPSGPPSVFLCHSRDDHHEPITAIHVLVGAHGDAVATQIAEAESAGSVYIPSLVEHDGHRVPAEIVSQLAEGFTLVPMNLNIAAHPSQMSGPDDLRTLFYSEDGRYFAPVYMAFSRDPALGSPITTVTPVSGRYENLEAPDDTFVKVPQNVNPGADTFVYLCYSDRGCPVVDLAVACGAPGSPDVEAPRGFRRLPVNLNMPHLGHGVDGDTSVEVYLCYKRGLEHPITDMELAPHAEAAEARRSEGYTALPLPGPDAGRGDSPFLCFRRGDGCPIQKVQTCRGHNEPPAYGDARVEYIMREEPDEASGGLRGKWAISLFDQVSFEVDPAELVSYAVSGAVCSTTGIGRGRIAGQLYCDPVSGKWVMEGTLKLNAWTQPGHCQLVWDDEESFRGTWTNGETAGEMCGERAERYPLHRERQLTRIYSPQEQVVFMDSTNKAQTGASPHPPQWELFAVRDCSDVHGPSAVTIQSFSGRFLSCSDAGTISWKTKETAWGVWYLDDDEGKRERVVVRSQLGHVLCQTNAGIRARMSDEVTEEQTLFRLKRLPPPAVDGSERAIGSWRTRDGQSVFLSIGERNLGRRVTGRFEPHGEPEDDWPRVEGLLWRPATSESPAATLTGYFFRPLSHPGASPIVVDFASDQVSLSGRCYIGDQQTSFRGRLDNYTAVAFERNYGEQWRGGKRICSNMARNEDLNSMVEQLLNREVMDDKNMYRCTSAVCHGQLRRAEKMVRITQGPEHLMITLKRFSYDFFTGARTKILREMDYPICFRLPLTRIADLKAMSREGDVAASSASAGGDVAPPGRLERASSAAGLMDESERPWYALYAVIVHSGTSANAGHYYCYARESDAADLLNEESNFAPWYRFDDTRVTRSSFAELKETTNRLPKDTAYILFYRRIPEDHPSHPGYAQASAPSAAGDAATTPAKKTKHPHKALLSPGPLPVPMWDRPPAETMEEEARLAVPTFELAPSEPEVVFRDNERYFDEVAREYSPFFRQHCLFEEMGLWAAPDARRYCPPVPLMASPDNQGNTARTGLSVDTATFNLLLRMRAVQQAGQGLERPSWHVEHEAARFRENELLRDAIEGEQDENGLLRQLLLAAGSAEPMTGDELPLAAMPLFLTKAAFAPCPACGVALPSDTGALVALRAPNSDERASQRFRLRSEVLAEADVDDEDEAKEPEEDGDGDVVMGAASGGGAVAVAAEVPEEDDEDLADVLNEEELGHVCSVAQLVAVHCTYCEKVLLRKQVRAHERACKPRFIAALREEKKLQVERSSEEAAFAAQAEAAAMMENLCPLCQMPFATQDDLIEHAAACGLG